jgi:maltose/moltooligosaccharide transporter
VGVFNFFIVIPQIVAAVILGWMLNLMYSDKPDPIGAVLIGAISFIVSAAFVSMVDDKDDPARIA